MGSCLTCSWEKSIWTYYYIYLLLAKTNQATSQTRVQSITVVLWIMKECQRQGFAKDVLHLMPVHIEYLVLTMWPGMTQDDSIYKLHHREWHVYRIFLPRRRAALTMRHTYSTAQEVETFLVQCRGKGSALVLLNYLENQLLFGQGVPLPMAPIPDNNVN